MNITNSQLSKIAGSGEGQRAIDQWVSSWVIWRQNELMEYILRTPECPCHDEIFEVACDQKVDYKGAIGAWMENNDIGGDLVNNVNDVPFTTGYQCLIFNDGEQVNYFGDMEIYVGDGKDELSAYADFCEQNEIDLDDSTVPVEIYEWYAIESYMVSRLECTVHDVFGMNLWGRTCTGQSISMDWNIQCLWAEMNPEAAIELAREIV